MRAIEDYQDQTEERWRRLAEGVEASACGWCEFDSSLSPDEVHGNCSMCPVQRVFGHGCMSIPVVLKHFHTHGSAGHEVARAVLKVAQEYREELIAAAKVIMEEVRGVLVWMQCTPQGRPAFVTASESKLESRSLLRSQLYPGENLSWAEIKADGWVEKQFRVEEVDNDKAD